MTKQQSISLNVLADYLFSQSSPECANWRIAFLDALIQFIIDDHVKEVVYYRHHLRQSIQLEVMTKIRTQKDKHLDITIHFKEQDQYNQQRSSMYSSPFFNHVVNEPSPFIEKETLIFNLLNFNIIQESEHFHNTYQVEPKTSPYKQSESIDLHYMELLKLRPRSNQSELEKWLYFLKSVSRFEQSEYFKDWLRHEPYFNDIYTFIKQHVDKMSDEILRRTSHTKTDYLLLKQGKEYGEKKERERIAINMIRLNIPYEDMMHYTNLTQDQIDSLALNYYKSN
ncbi:PD-(D/E)XK nuclease family transposase [Pelagirhabdus alkalitolerans]|uniref:PD-(D/E)XK nuclease family transposase n=1 Tax=Pelagirhabdus alkalitolerans TaxID=1612202 RepID=A0A1G6IX81_9BACI|nr:PD-(D/E)XK nuclease family transposase [Pelagirhabdus alkalitolerans]SDC11172.1 PD-(D/E)XK nuclease family transposase [Pelagirhabdus alkalitolerans]